MNEKCVIAAVLLLLPLASPAGIEWPDLQYELVSDAFTRPVDIQSPPNGSNDLYVVEKRGFIRVLIGGRVFLSAPFLDIDSRVAGGTSEFSEQGLLGLVFDPDFATNGYFYVNYTTSDTRVSRFSMVPGNPYQADPNSEYVLLSVDQPFSNHNGGQLQFGPNGYLYIGLGDGGSANDPGNRAQNPQELLGKMLRIDVHGDDFPEDADRNYAIPDDNPFVSDESVADEIWALGLRNPWRFSFDSATGDLFIADVGQNVTEEVDFQPAESGGGENYGWRVFEGSDEYITSLGLGPGQLVGPVAEHAHSVAGADNCSITGGYVYRGSRYPRMAGVYIYADWCSGRIWGLREDGEGWVGNELDNTEYGITSFGIDGAGNLFFADQEEGAIYRLGDTVETSPEWPQLAGFEVVSDGLIQPTDIQGGGDGSGRLYIAQWEGEIAMLKNGVLLSEPFLDISDRVAVGNGDEGLTGIAFPPEFAQKGYFYVGYVRGVPTSRESVVSRFSLSGNPDVADPDSEEILLVVPEPSGHHNVSQLQFGPDGYLYIGFGDGGPQDDGDNLAQDAGSLHGKILRIDTEGVPSVGETYKIPPDNPFLGDAGVRDEIWSVGFRNPWRFSFDTESGLCFIGDVGRADWEEINAVPLEGGGGRNFGWRNFEGRHVFNDTLEMGPGLVTFPAVEFPYGPMNRSISAGYVYRGEAYPGMAGVFFFGDFVSGRIWGMQSFGGEWLYEELLDTDWGIATFGHDDAGNLYVADFHSGKVYHLGDSAAKSVLPATIQASRNENNQFSFSFPTLPGRAFQVQGSGDGGQTWVDLGNPVAGSGGLQAFTDESSAVGSEETRLYRAVLTGEE